MDYFLALGAESLLVSVSLSDELAGHLLTTGHITEEQKSAELSSVEMKADLDSAV